MPRPDLLRHLRVPLGLLLAAAALGGMGRFGQPKPFSEAATAALYTTPVPPPEDPLKVFHLGHSLVGHDMPAMLAQLAGPGHDYALQLGWGTPLKAHWDDATEITGFDEANATPAFRPAKETLAEGAQDALIVTEMIDIKTSIRHHDSAQMLANWAGAARAGNPDIRVYLYETWPWISVRDGWLSRLDGDLGKWWLRGVLRPALALDPEHRPIYLIPGGQVMAAFTRRMEAGAVPGMTRREALFRKTPEGEQDTIHFNDHGAYLMALTHYAVLYGRNPVGLPHDLKRADGTAMTPLSAEAAEAMQEVVWEVVSALPMTGVEGDT